MTGTLIAYLVVGLVLVAGGIPLAMRKVRPNPWYGFRTKSTMSDERLWFAANASAGRVLVTGGIVAILTVVFLYFQDVPEAERKARFSSAALMLVTIDMLVVILVSAFRLRTIKKKLGIR
ncbi:MAG TPA: SdpI family protein [Spirochaetota bacterium]|nr:SdpI family protein [Spirochaetota bacterium]HPN82597.1 SdpI family protein [Spirochaetota bacterium]